MLNELLQSRNLPAIPDSREEIKETLQREIYGYMPEKPDSVHFEENKSYVSEGRFPCGAVLKAMTATVSVNGREFSFPFRTAFHTDGVKRPFFVHINFRPDTPDLYQPTEEILDNGFNIISFCYKDVTSDEGDFTNGLADIFVGTNGRTSDKCGKIMMWAWAAMRMLDYAETNPAFDMNNAAVIGHSRLGKTALVTGMFDERVKYIVSNNSGCGGAAITRGKKGEQIADITKKFPYWFCENYKKYANNHFDAPFDQNFLLASVAPRYLYVCSSSLDSWADPDSEYLGCVSVSDYFKGKGTKNGFVCPDRFPNAGEYFHDGEIGYHIKQGEHFLSRYDWNEIMRFIRLKMGEINENN